MAQRLCSRSFFVSLLLLFGLLLQASAQQAPDYSQLRPTLNGNIPREVPAFPFSAFPIDTRPMFDYFMWQNFIALMWPADAHGTPFQPDNPAVFGKYDAGRQPAWVGWKSAYDLYTGDGSAPPAWDQSNGESVCRNYPANDTRLMLIRFTKFGTVADELDQAFAGPLPDQTGLFTRYSIGVNRAEYDFIRDNQYYLRAKWPANGKITLPASSLAGVGSMEIKAAWRDLSKVPRQFWGRFYHVPALAAIPDTCRIEKGTQRTTCDCQPIEVGLVGFHIAHKTTNFPQWVWSTFEQVDNLGEDPTTPPEMQPSYYDPEFYKKHGGMRSNPPDHPGSSRVPGANDYDPTPINVVRLSAIPSTPQGHSTTDMNKLYRALFKGTVWENYQLIGTQWSSLPSFAPQSPLNSDFGCEDGTLPAAGGMPFPPCQVANITMETYHQYDSCQNCHQGAQRAGADFSWILAIRAYAPPSAPKPVFRFFKPFSALQGGQKQ
jgi:hypothetical protein